MDSLMILVLFLSLALSIAILLVVVERRRRSTLMNLLHRVITAPANDQEVADASDDLAGR